MKHALRITLAALLISAATITAQPPDETPEQIVERSLTLTQSGDLYGCAQLMAPSALESYRDLMLPVMLLMRSSLNDAIAAGQDAPAEVAQALSRVDSLPPDSFYAATFDALTLLIPDFKAALTGLQGEIVGSINEGDTLVHVVTRSSMNMQGMDFVNAMKVSSLRRTDNGWRIILSQEIYGLAARLQQALGGQ